MAFRSFATRRLPPSAPYRPKPMHQRHDIDHYRDADGEPVQPYFAAFMIEHGYTRAKSIFERDGNGLEYMDWNRARWREFRTLHGIDRDFQHFHAAEFREWLRGRSLDHLARTHVEAEGRRPSKQSRPFSQRRAA